MLPDKKRFFKNFNCCSCWEEKYLYIIELGKELKKSKSLYLSKNVVPGCLSKVWIDLSFEKDNKTILYGDSDAALVKGLIALIFIFYNGLKAKEILTFDIEKYLKKICINQNLTNSRIQGLYSIIKKIHVRVNEFLNLKKK
ncbi:SufE family protein [Candidatus Tachikawaea gelatinosa]|uniref:Cysteine desulfuration protein SufE n=1 Tax=Candidatus Tachikawaea gelatinosa TaxID=1410383 RepID=A0A090BWI6_9ENTR|nr:SufE family protein [Candidatus Tachikawaea gelatinosa]BAP58671.1 cysteine desulfuration protein SufE [Candidatus Tachikawaea gelatinosa]